MTSIFSYEKSLNSCLKNDCIKYTGIEVIWGCIQESFAPWIQTVISSKVVSQPWIAADRESASHMVKALVDVVKYAHYKTEGNWRTMSIICLTFKMIRLLIFGTY
jgi:hypothetical protein